MTTVSAAVAEQTVVAPAQEASAVNIAVGETGTVTLDNTIDQGFVATVNLVNSYTAPVVVAFINTRNGDNSVDVRVRNVTDSSFEIFMEGPDDQGHVSETASYMVMEAGRYLLDGGLVVEAGIIRTAEVHFGGTGYNGEVVTFAQPFATAPAVLHTLNSYNNGRFMSSAAHSVSTTSFTTEQEAAEAGDIFGVAAEDIAWIALATGSGTTNGAAYEIGMSNDGSNDGVDNTPHTISFSSFTAVPDVVAKMILLNTSSANGAWARGAGSYNSTTQTVYAEEDQVGDAERNHNDETFAWAAFAADTTLVAPMNCFVETTGDNVADYFSQDASALRSAIANAASGAVLKIAGTCAGTTTVLGSSRTVLIDKSLTLQGGYTTTNWLAAPNLDLHPTTLDAEGNGRVVVIASGDHHVTLDKLIIQNGYSAQGSGGGIGNGSNLTLTHSIVTNNVAAAGRGGGINVTTGSLYVDHSIVANNRAIAGRDGGGIASSRSQLTIAYSEIYSNSARGTGGGLDLLEGSALIQHSTIYNNSSNGGGGAIRGDSASATLENSTVTGNFAGQFAAIHFSDNDGDATPSTLILTHTTVANNMSEGIRIRGNVSSALAESEAGGEELPLVVGARQADEKMRALIYSSVIAGNSDDDCNAGGDSVLLDASGGYNVDSDGTCIGGGGAGNITADPLLESLADNGGATPTMALMSSSPAIDRVPVGANGCGTTITGDQRGETRPQSIQCDSGAYESSLVGNWSCFVETTGDNVIDYVSLDATAVQSAVDDAVSGDLIKIAGTCAGVQTRSGQIQSVYIDKSLTLRGGYTNTNWLVAPNPDTYPTVLDAEDNGRVIMVANGNNHVTLDGLTIQNGYDATGGGGGGINTTDSLSITHSIVANNDTSSRGGGIRISSGVLYVSHSRIAYNDAAAGGGGISSTDSQLTIADSEIYSNTTDSFGGGLALVNDNVVIQQSTLYNNSANRGSALHGEKTTATLQNSTVTGNSAGSLATIYLFTSNAPIASTLILTHTTVANNVGRGIQIVGNASSALAKNEGDEETVAPTEASRQANEAGRALIYSSVIAGNSGNDCRATGNSVLLDASGGYNVDSDGTCIVGGGVGNITADPLLEPLAENGGATPTMALMPSSPAIDRALAGANGCGTTIITDQRGEPRPENGACDSGAYEREITAVAPALTISNNQLTHSNDNPSCTYNLYQSSSPYSGFGLAQANIGTTPIDISGDVGGAPDYYYVEVDCGRGSPASGATAVSNTVGEFSFAIVPGG